MTSQTRFVVSGRGIIHVPDCPAAQKAKGLLRWDVGDYAQGDRRCLRCFPALPTGWDRRTRPPAPSTRGASA